MAGQNYYQPRTGANTAANHYSHRPAHGPSQGYQPPEPTMYGAPPAANQTLIPYEPPPQNPAYPPQQQYAPYNNPYPPPPPTGVYDTRYAPRPQRHHRTPRASPSPSPPSSRDNSSHNRASKDNRSSRDEPEDSTTPSRRNDTSGKLIGGAVGSMLGGLYEDHPDLGRLGGAVAGALSANLLQGKWKERKEKKNGAKHEDEARPRRRYSDSAQNRSDDRYDSESDDGYDWKHASKAPRSEAGFISSASNAEYGDPHHRRRRRRNGGGYKARRYSDGENA